MPARKKEKKGQYRTGYVALIGRPNSGKSTLLNALIGQKIAIVSDKPQTTRISLLGIKTTNRGQIIFVDNPGVHKPLHLMNRRMMNYVYSSLETADLLLLLIEANKKFGQGDKYVLDMLKKINRPVFLLINKIDLVKKDKILPVIDKYKDLFPFREIIPISALRGDNLNLLENLIYDYLPLAEKIYSDEEITDQSERFLLSEIIREKILNLVEEELPYTTAVVIHSIERPQAEGSPLEAEKSPAASSSGSQPLIRIKADILVERENHKGIIIGRQGSMIKTIGSQARKEIEDILESRVFLELSVRVKEKWRDSEEVLDLIEEQKE
ncbi:MAG TPA: GTPase Era [Candidatus Saccharicenans sp.]|nr:GTPase Era [Candidatus Saccharicenans sp.]HQO75508.1 GTPase Era [Candidatus Saccharicenans sp.]HUM78532.1 GTPase Era [Candidatus Saccharicenans sp.]